jgi:hypothetical protein
VSIAAAVLLGVHAAAAAVAAGGLARLLAAGSQQRRGRLDRSRRMARGGGRALAAGALVQAATGVAAVAAWGRVSESPALWAVAVVACLAAGWAGLLAGLSGKPRPGGGTAGTLLAVGTAAWLLVLV